MPLFVILLKRIQRGVQVDAAEDSFNYCQSIVVLRQSLIAPEEITIDRGYTKKSPLILLMPSVFRPMISMPSCKRNWHLPSINVGFCPPAKPVLLPVFPDGNG